MAIISIVMVALQMMAGQSRYGDRAIALEFAQVGRDQGAQVPPPPPPPSCVVC